MNVNERRRGKALPKAAKGSMPMVVGIGASAGGLQALEAFFDAMPVGTGIAFVLIQHLSPDFKSLMNDLLARHTPLKIEHVRDGARIEPDRVYLNQPKSRITVKAGCFRVEPARGADLPAMPIDIFLSSLAKEAPNRCVGVILSGTGSDGSRGIRDIARAGGLVLVQDTVSAQFDGMPRSAADTGIADFVGTPEDMPKAILSWLADPDSLARFSSLQPDDAVPLATAGDEKSPMQRIFDFLRRDFGIDFAQYKPTTVGRRIERRMALCRCLGMKEYADLLEQDAEEIDALYRDLLIGVTRFFRDSRAFVKLGKQVLPKLFERAKDSPQVRAWVAGCATGEEAYSVAILLKESAERAGYKGKINVFATDVHRRSLDFASLGRYDAKHIAGVPSEYLSRYFLKDDDGAYRIVPELRKLVIFAAHNALSDPPFTNIDLITCRNMLIYLDPAAQERVIALFHFALRPQGILFLGSSEGTGILSGEFEVVDAQAKIYSRIGEGKLPMFTRRGEPGADAHWQAVTPHRAGSKLTLDRVLVEDYDALLGRYLAPGLLVDENSQILHYFGDASRYLKGPAGRSTADLFAALDGDLRLAVSTSLLRAQKQDGPVVTSGVAVTVGGEAKTLIVTAERVAHEKARINHFFIGFREAQEAAAPVPAADWRSSAAGESVFELTDESRRRIADLEYELQLTKSDLQATIQELQTSNEELQATNEEMLASNEELQSTNEELHSVNEELYSVNAEYERKNEELRQLNQDHENLLGSLQTGIVFLDENLRIRKFNPAIADFFHLMQQDVGRPIEHIAYHLGDQETMLADVRRVMASGLPAEGEVQARSGRWFLKRALPFVTDGARIAGVVLTFTDITLLKQVLESEERFRTMVENLPTGAALIQGGEITINRAAEVMTGYSRTEMHTPDDWRSRFLPEGRLDGQSQFVPGAGDDEGALLREMRVKRKDGSTIHVEVSMYRFSQGEVWLLYDLGARKRAEEESRRLAVSLEERVHVRTAELEQSNRELEAFSYSVSHDLRTPLRAIDGFSHALLDEYGAQLDEKGHAYLNRVRQATQRMGDLIDDLLELARVSRWVLQRQPVDLCEQAGEIVQALQAADSGRQLEFICAGTEPLIAHADPGLTRVVLENLMRNAWKFTRTRQLARIEFGRTVVDGETVYFFRDNGVGFDMAFAAKLFGNFQRLHAGSEFEGEGIGLAIVNRILRKHGGRIWAEGRPEEGATFYFTLGERGA